MTKSGVRRSTGRIGVRLLITAALVAGVLVPATMAPARTRTIMIPATLSGSVQLAARAGRVHLGFEATHIAFSWTGDEGTGVRYQLLGGGSSRTAWQRAPESGDMHEGTKHYSAIISIDRARLLRFQPITPRGTSISSLALDYLNTSDGPLQARTVSAAGRSSATTPNIITRAEWGADESLKSTSGGCTRRFYPVQQLFVHHTAGKNKDPDPAATMRAINWYHTVRRGWCDLGYNFVISWDGQIFEGRWARSYGPWETHSSEDLDGQAVSGAHVANFNSGSVGVSLMGNFQTRKVPSAMKTALASLLAWEVDRHDIPARGKHVFNSRTLPFIAGHRDAGQTSCPGENLYKILWKIRRSVEAQVGEGRPTTTTTLATPERKIVYGDSAPLSGRLLDQFGSPLAGRTLDLYRRNGKASKWFVADQPLTDLNGNFTYSLTPERNTKLRAVFPEATDLWGSQSHDLRIKVRHKVTLEAQGGAPDPSGARIYPPGTTSVTLVGKISPLHGGSVAMVHVFKVNSDSTTTRLKKAEALPTPEGNYSYIFEVPAGDGSQTFTALTWYASDPGHLAGRSDTVRFVIPG